MVRQPTYWVAFIHVGIKSPCWLTWLYPLRVPLHEYFRRVCWRHICFIFVSFSKNSKNLLFFQVYLWSLCHLWKLKILTTMRQVNQSVNQSLTQTTLFLKLQMMVIIYIGVQFSCLFIFILFCLIILDLSKLLTKNIFVFFRLTFGVFGICESWSSLSWWWVL